MVRDSRRERRWSLVNAGSRVLLLAMVWCGCGAQGESRSVDVATPPPAVDATALVDTANTGGDALADCPDIAGLWEIIEHCEPSGVGLQATVTQLGCDFTSTANGLTYSGTIDADGVFSVTFMVNGEPWSCAGVVEGNTLIETCNGACVIRLERLP